MTEKTLQTDLKKNPAYIAIATCQTKATKKSYTLALGYFIRADCESDKELAAEFMPNGELIKGAIYKYSWGALDANKIKLILSQMGIMPRTYNKYLAAIKNVIRILHADTDLVTKNFNFADYMRLDQILKLKGRSPGDSKAGRSLSEGEILKLQKVIAADKSAAGARDD
ncbi:MAG: hypothetical protein IIC78_15190, partial [Chloroflexi bacterium]|nr:hypothetical protein [Chloroflexota bacterium]